MPAEAVPISDEMIAYFASRDAARHRQVNDVLHAMTKREYRLVCEVAVMANVRAKLRAGDRTEPALDAEVVLDTIAAALAMPDLYPTIARLARNAARRSRRAAQTEE